MRRVRLVVAYDGTNYCGWQIQPNGITIEEVLNREISRLTREDIHIIGASRTDSGVHALGNVAVFDTASSVPPERMAYALNQRLPGDIVIVRSDEAASDWHPRYQDEIAKTYEYHIYNAPMPNPLKRNYSAFVSFPMDAEKMRKGAEYLVGEHDFVSFCNIRTSVSDTVRTVHSITVVQNGPDIVLRITGNGFLYHMVRILTGTLLEVGTGKRSPEDMMRILESLDRKEAGPMAPAQGLCLWKVEYKD